MLPNAQTINPSINTVIAFYHVFKGAHVIFNRTRVPKIRDVYTRLYKEVEMTRVVAEYMHFELDGFYNFEWNENNIRVEVGKEMVDRMAKGPLDKLIEEYNNKRINEKLVTCDLDLNPNPYWKSNMVHDTGVGVIKGSGFRCRTKPNAYSASCAADLICK